VVRHLKQARPLSRRHRRRSERWDADGGSNTSRATIYVRPWPSFKSQGITSRARRLGIGYNRAASLVERMEKEGLIGPANHAGKREILVGGDDAERPY
jgi:DNA segregation ATPase FtsK/SpoIIIE-like protein